MSKSRALYTNRNRVTKNELVQSSLEEVRPTIWRGFSFSSLGFVWRSATTEDKITNGDLSCLESSPRKFLRGFGSNPDRGVYCESRAFRCVKVKSNPVPLLGIGVPTWLLSKSLEVQGFPVRIWAVALGTNTTPGK